MMEDSKKNEERISEQPEASDVSVESPEITEMMKTTIMENTEEAGKSDDTGIPEDTEKLKDIVLSDDTGKSEEAGKSEDTDKSEDTGKTEETGKAEDTNDPVKIEADFCSLLAPEKWSQFSHLMIALGRTKCKANRPDCPNCPLKELCSHGRKHVA